MRYVLVVFLCLSQVSVLEAQERVFVNKYAGVIDSLTLNPKENSFRFLKVDEEPYVSLEEVPMNKHDSILRQKYRDSIKKLPPRLYKIVVSGTYKLSERQLLLFPEKITRLRNKSDVGITNQFSYNPILFTTQFDVFDFDETCFLVSEKDYNYLTGKQYLNWFKKRKVISWNRYEDIYKAVEFTIRRNRYAKLKGKPKKYRPIDMLRVLRSKAFREFTGKQKRITLSEFVDKSPVKQRKKFNQLLVHSKFLD